MNPSPWQVLGLAPGADARAIKRAYARLLKEVRPEADRERFLLVRWAYEAAMAADVARHHVAEPPRPEVVASEPAFVASFDVVETPAIPATLELPRRPVRADPVPLHALPVEVVDVDAFANLRPPAAVAGVLHEAVFTFPAALLAAIEASPELLSLVERPLIEDLVLARLLRDERVPSHDTFDLLAQYFHWFEIGGRSQRVRDTESAAFDRYLRRIAARDEVARARRNGDTQDGLRMGILTKGWRWWTWLYLMAPGEWLAVAQMLWRFRSRFGAVAGELLDAVAVRRIERIAERRKLHWEQLVISVGPFALLSIVLVPMLAVTSSLAYEAMLRVASGAMLAVVALNVLRVSIHRIGELSSRLLTAYQQLAASVVRKRAWLPPVLRVLVPVVFPFMCWLRDGEEWVVYNIAGVVALLVTASGGLLAIVDLCGVALWTFVFGTARHLDPQDTGPWIGLSIVVLAVARELARIPAEGPEQEQLMLSRAAVALALPAGLIFLIVELTDTGMR